MGQRGLRNHNGDSLPHATSTTKQKQTSVRRTCQVYHKEKVRFKRRRLSAFDGTSASQRLYLCTCWGRETGDHEYTEHISIHHTPSLPKMLRTHNTHPR